ncbi:uncharacterized protein METZ01_LOCUS31805, partial [marine metagenome]
VRLGVCAGSLVGNSLTSSDIGSGGVGSFRTAETLGPGSDSKRASPGVDPWTESTSRSPLDGRRGSPTDSASR